MKIVTILGSPKGKGNTAKVLGTFEELVAKEQEIYRINLASCDVKGCLGCGACQTKIDEPGCVHKDDGQSLFERMMSADALVYASPIYMWGFPSQMKALLDRHFCLVTGYFTPDHKSLLAGKRTALLATCAGPIENNTEFLQGIFDNVSAYTKSEVVGKYLVPLCTTPEAMSPLGEERARELATDLVGH